jgi:hypothetical protein
MRKFLFVLFFSIALPYAGKAQVSISSADMPQAGDTLRFSISVLDTAVLFGYQNNGPNQFWRFDSLVALRQGLNSYVTSANTPYASQVSNRIGQKLTDTLSLGGINLYESVSVSFCPIRFDTWLA